MSRPTSHKLLSVPLLLLTAVLLGLAAAGGYYYVHPERLPEWAAKTQVGRDLQTTKVYRWKDASGTLHITDRPPAAGIEYQQQSYHRDDNVLPLPPELQR